MSDFMLVLSLLYCWPVSGYALVLVCASNKKKLVTWEVKIIVKSYMLLTINNLSVVLKLCIANFPIVLNYGKKNTFS